MASRRLSWVVILTISCGLLFIWGLFSIGKSKAIEQSDPFSVSALEKNNKRTVNLGSGVSVVVSLTPTPKDKGSFPYYVQAIGDTWRISVDSMGVQGVGHSSNGFISMDGIYISFDSKAPNLVPNDTNGKDDVFLHHRVNQQTSRISLTYQGLQANGNSTYPSLSRDGRYVSFRSDATNLVPNDTNNFIDIFVRDNLLGTVTRVSVASDGTQANGNSLYSMIAADTMYVAFHSDATNLVIGDTNNVTDVFVHDMNIQQTIRVSVSSSDAQANGESRFPAISTDGRYVVFHSAANNLVSGDSNNAYDIFIRDLQLNSTSLVSLAYNGLQGNGNSTNPSISESGRYVAFQSEASNLVPNDTNGVADIFVRDLQLSSIQRVSVDSNGFQANSWSAYPRISPDGRYVVFESAANNLVPNDTNGQVDIFMRDRQLNYTVRVSVSTFGAQGNGGSSYPFISGDGRFVTFHSDASNLVPNDTNGMRDVFIHELEGNTPTPSITPSPTFTHTPTASNTPTPSLTPSITPTITNTPTNTATRTPTITPSATNTPTNTLTPTKTNTPTATFTASITPSPTPTFTITPTPVYSYTPTQTPTNTLTPTITNTPIITLTPSFTPTFTRTFTPSPTKTPTLTPTITPTPTNTFTPTRTPTFTQTPIFTLTPTATITITRIPRCSIQGYVLDSDGVPIVGATLIANKFPVAKSENNGFYTIEGLTAGEYEIGVDYLEMEFISLIPTTVECPTGATGLDFYAVGEDLFTISGRVANMQGQGMAGIPISYSREQDSESDQVFSSIVITDYDGRYTIEKLPWGVYHLSAAMPGHYFTPHNRIVVLPPNAKNQDFVSSAPIRVTYQIKGEVKDAKGNPIRGVYILLGGKFRAITDSRGQYIIRGLLPGWYVISAEKEGYLLKPPQRVINIPRDSIIQPFVATLP